MDLRKLKKLIDLVEDSGIAELEVTEGEEKVKIVKGGGAGKEVVVLSPSAVPVAVSFPPTFPSPPPPGPAPPAPARAPPAPPPPRGRHLKTPPRVALCPRRSP